nr:hypothetical protein Itr_chr14CG12970 [Ipomoea trifida]
MALAHLSGDGVDDFFDKSTKLLPGRSKAEDPLPIHPNRIEEFVRPSNGTGPGGTLWAASISISIGLKRGVTKCDAHDSSDLEISTLLVGIVCIVW